MESPRITVNVLLAKIGTQAIELDAARSHLQAAKRDADEARELLETIRAELDPAGELAAAMRSSAEPVVIVADSPLGRLLARPPEPPPAEPPGT